MHRRLTSEEALPAAGRRQYPETFKVLACSHALEDLFQRSGFTWQRPFDGLRRNLLLGSCVFIAKEQAFLQRLSPMRRLFREPKNLYHNLSGGRDFPCRLKPAVPLA